ncbi:isovaleryl-CoA dehydrogenase, mitochondrial [Drosophila virilis]|uniref:Isobutyryl-CoA dehydrogenase, mitochondrial n=1 Tax=Drosophila virilis TaxID=7244 RepID=B4LEK0_DROVI|nr:isovaleryl-CoA dehydrogenase, mitochondrial [Drosophila virilis]XP_015030870.1 isovaleryl-CoA dehydrogenase, mitochondrial [Drosophila virilis]EDW69085.2 uncharacterized protein Dvir_GJ12315, isoform A [Drosophila virilis]KRF84167.1 uncharacterized protein Dvir_GJ12315, isoform B [Drosophila virilis]
MLMRCVSKTCNTLLHKCGRPLAAATPSSRTLTHYPVNDALYGLDKEHQKLREATFNFAQKELAPYAKEIDKEDNFKDMRSFWRKLGELGYLGITVDPEYGGTGGSYLDHSIVVEEISRASGAVGVSYGAHSNMCINQLSINGTHEQKQQYLPKLCSGVHIGGLAMSEVGAGSDVLAMKLRAERKGDYYLLNGTKFWISNGSDADTLIVYAKTGASGDPDRKAITAFIIETSWEGFSVGKKLDKLGIRGSSTCELVFDNVKVPAKNVLGQENNGVYVLMSGLDYERAVLSGVSMGLMQAACDVAFEYAHERKQMGKLIGEFQLIQGKMADMYTTISSCRSYFYTVVRSLDAGMRSSKDCAGVFLLCGEKSTQVALDAMQILGGNGYINDYPTGRILRDAKLCEIAGGTAEIRRWLIGRQLNQEYK